MHLLFDLLAFLQAQLSAHADAMLLPAAVILGVPMLAAAAWPVATKHLRTALRTARVRRAGSVEAPRVHAAGEDGVTGDPMDLLNAFARQRKSHVIVLGGSGDGDGSKRKGAARQAEIAEIMAPLEFFRAYKDIPKAVPVDIILDGNMILDLSGTRRIAKTLLAHRGPVTVVVPFQAFGSACLLTLVADNVIMSPDAVLVFDVRNMSQVIDVTLSKSGRHMGDTFLLNLYAKVQHFVETKRLAALLLKSRKRRRWRSVARRIALGDYNSSNPAYAETLRSWGLDVRVVGPNSSVDLPSLNVPPPTLLAAARQNADTLSTIAELAPVCAAACPTHHVRDAMVAIENSRGSKVISIIHATSMSERSFRSQTIAEALRAIRATPAGTDLDIILHTPGGEALGAAQLARALKAHQGRKTFFVPYQAFSAGTLLALTGDEICLSEFACIGPVDVQITMQDRLGGEWMAEGLSETILLPENDEEANEPRIERKILTTMGHLHFAEHGTKHSAAAFRYLLSQKRKKDIEDNLLVTALAASERSRDDHRRAMSYMKGNYSWWRARRIAHTLNDGHLSHAFPIMYDDARQIGLNVRLGVPDEVFTIVDHFLEQGDGHCSVVHCSG
jgi:hypothetical protein